MDAKLSSVSVMVAASLATSVPEIPMAIPMSARLSAGASFTPSPVMATTSPPRLSAETIRSLCAGDTRAKTEVPGRTCASASSLMRSRATPVTAAPSPPKPSSRAMAAAVVGWSPVVS